MYYDGMQYVCTTRAVDHELNSSPAFWRGVCFFFFWLCLGAWVEGSRLARSIEDKVAACSNLVDRCIFVGDVGGAGTSTSGRVDLSCTEPTELAG